MLRDADIREPLFDFLEQTYGKVRILEEKRIGRSRADVVMVTPEAIYGLEIKSDADSYSRLASQVKDYDKYYDYNFAVVGTSHAMHIGEHVPEYWGIITVEEIDGKADFYVFRRPKINPRMNLKYKLKILWRPELAIIQAQNDMPKYKQASKDTVINKIVERTKLSKDKKGHIELEELAKQVGNVLLERDYNDIGASLKEYYKGELQKKIEAETDPQRRLELMNEQAARRERAQKQLPKNKRRRRR